MKLTDLKISESEIEKLKLQAGTNCRCAQIVACTTDGNEIREGCARIAQIEAKKKLSEFGISISG